MRAMAAETRSAAVGGSEGAVVEADREGPAVGPGSAVWGGGASAEVVVGAAKTGVTTPFLSGSAIQTEADLAAPPTPAPVGPTTRIAPSSARHPPAKRRC